MGSSGRHTQPWHLIRLPGGRSPRALGAIAAQFSQALGSFLFQLLAARNLSLEAFGVFALLLSGIVLATGIMTGFVGDSLTVLDRGDGGIRAGLQVWCLTIAAITLVCGAVVGLRSGAIGTTAALLFGAALAAWVIEDTVRRLLMANLRFWSVVAVDLSHLAVAVAVLGAAAVLHGRLVLEDFLLALILGQLSAIVVGLGLAPATERRLASWRSPALGAVARFGFWRGTQQGIRPATLTVARLLVVVVAGKAAVGQLEAARVYMAPALLVVQGVGSFLLASYAASRQESIRRAVRRADKAAIVLVGASLAIGAVATLSVRWAGSLITGDAYDIDPVAVAGWATFSASVAAVMPYASLAAVRGRQILVVLLRLADAALSIGTVAVALWALDLDPAVTPFGIAAGAFAGALLQRRAALSAGTDSAAERVGDPAR